MSIIERGVTAHQSIDMPLDTIDSLLDTLYHRALQGDRESTAIVVSTLRQHRGALERAMKVYKRHDPLTGSYVIHGEGVEVLRMLDFVDLLAARWTIKQGAEALESGNQVTEPGTPQNELALVDQPTIGAQQPLPGMKVDENPYPYTLWALRYDAPHLSKPRTVAVAAESAEDAKQWFLANSPIVEVVKVEQIKDVPPVRHRRVECFINDYIFADDVPVPSLVWSVWAIEYELPRVGAEVVVAVSAESEYGAIKRLCGNRCVLVKRMEIIPGRKPQYNQRRIEGLCDHTFSSEGLWEYT